MLPPEILKQIRKLEIRTNRMVDEIIGGAYHSVFKGRGIEFDEVREYSSDDDIRDIDWNVTARMGVPYIKKYVEERELNVMLLVDVSGSSSFGSRDKSKRQLSVEIAAMLAFSAIGNNDKVGLMLFSDQVELYLPPRSGRKHVLRLIREMLAHQSSHSGTDLNFALQETIRILNKRSVVFLVSDFLDENYEVALKIANRKHDVIAVRVTDPCETAWPLHLDAMLEDAETGELVAFGGSARHQQTFAAAAAAEQAAQKKVCDRAKVDLIDLHCGEDPLRPLVEFFQRRRRRQTRR